MGGGREEFGSFIWLWLLLMVFPRAIKFALLGWDDFSRRKMGCVDFVKFFTKSLLMLWKMLDLAKR